MRRPPFVSVLSLLVFPVCFVHLRDASYSLEGRDDALLDVSAAGCEVDVDDLLAVVAVSAKAFVTVTIELHVDD